MSCIPWGNPPINICGSASICPRRPDLCKCTTTQGIWTYVPQCVDIGCQECPQNAYCHDGDIVEGDVQATAIGNLYACPARHTCSGHSLATAPVCVDRPVFDDFRVYAAANSQSPQNTFGTAPNSVANQLGRLVANLRIPNKVNAGCSCIDPVDIEADTVLSGGFRFGQGVFRQGYLEFVFRTVAPTHVSAMGCTGSAGQLFVRLRLQPYFAAGDFSNEPPYYVGQTRWHLAAVQLAMDLEHGTGLPPVSIAPGQDFDLPHNIDLNDLPADAIGALEGGVGTLWHYIAEDMIVGGWIVGRSDAIAELDTAHDVVCIRPSSGKVACTSPADCAAGQLCNGGECCAFNQGDGDPADTIQTIRLFGPQDPGAIVGGKAYLAYRER